MALTNAGINQVRSSMDNIDREQEKGFGLHTPGNFSKMINDENFNNFIAGTQFGQENYEKWKKLVELMIRDCRTAIANVQSATRIYLSRQEELNNMIQAKLSNAKLGNDRFVVKE